MMTKLNVDCLNLIFDELKEDKNSLLSCLLVNKEWCNIAVSILWKKHSWDGDSWYDSRYDYGGNGPKRKLFSTILSCLPLSSKEFLSDNDIKLPSTVLLRPTSFNYISFCEFPKAKTVDKIIEMVFEEEFIKSYSGSDDQWKLLEQEMYKLFVSQCKNIRELSWKTSQPLPLFQGASTCFSQLYKLYIDVDFVDSNSLHEMAKFCKDLNELSIYKSQDLSGLISLVDAQRNLKRVTIYHNRNKKGNCKELGKALARKGNTINYLYLGSVSAIPPSFLTSLTNLKDISILNGEGYDDNREEIKELQKYLGILEFPKLEYLTVDRLSCFKELANLIEKTKGDISDVIIMDTSKTAQNIGMLIKAISNNCPRIVLLSIYLEIKDFIHVKLLLLNCRDLEFIRFYSLGDFVDEDANRGDELLDILTKFSPNSLKDIRISGSWKYSVQAFEQLFESCRERTLSYFAIFRVSRFYFITKYHEAVVKKYVEEGVIKKANYRQDFIFSRRKG